MSLAAYRLQLQLAVLKRTGRPIILGPWRGEVGFEVLYWLPWLSYVLSRAAMPISQVYVLSRGGAGQWYGLDKDHILDLYVLRPVDEVRRQMQLDVQRQGKIKQYSLTAWDRGVIRQACAHWNITRPWVLDPGQMFHLFDDFWEGKRGLPDVLTQTRWDRLPKPVMQMDGLPPKFYAMRFYARPTFKPTGDTVKFIQKVVQGLTKRMPVVVLGTPYHLDDHVDLPFPTGDNVFMVPTVDPSEVLMQQTAVIAASQGFVGTYGGIAQLAMRLGVPSLSFYDQWKGTLPVHRHLSEEVSHVTGVPFYTVRMNDVSLWSHVWEGLSSRAVK
jgi:hypothetical protein